MSQGLPRCIYPFSPPLPPPMSPPLSSPLPRPTLWQTRKARPTSCCSPPMELHPRSDKTKKSEGFNPRSFAFVCGTPITAKYRPLLFPPLISWEPSALCASYSPFRIFHPVGIDTVPQHSPSYQLSILQGFRRNDSHLTQFVTVGNGYRAYFVNVPIRNYSLQPFELLLVLPILA
jgi:hypothetical protein